MKKFIVHSTRWVKNGRKAGYFRDHTELVETDDILEYIRKHYTMVFGVKDKKRTFCSAVEVEDNISISYKYIEKVGGLHIGYNKDDIVVDTIQQKKYLTKYDYKLKGWL